jgi:CheY-like chemotaxis protein
MPGMNGHQVFREIRAREQDIPIIIISASDKQEDAIEALRLRAFDFIRKPLRDFVLVNAIRQALAPDEEVAIAMDSAPSAEAPLAANPPPTATPAAEDARLLNVLLADDSESGRLLITAYLHKTPYRLVLARNGAEALERFEEAAFHVVLMDMKMPGMDGLTATRRLREIEKRLGRPRTPVIALTAHALSDQIKASLDAGCDAHVTKPVTRETLLAHIVAATKKSSEPHATEKTPVQSDADAALAAPVGASTASTEPIAPVEPMVVVAPVEPVAEPFVVPGHMMFQYIEGLRQNIKSIQEALIAGDLAAAGAIGHGIRGTGTSYGFAELTDLGAAIEQAAESGDATVIRSATKKISTVIVSLSHRMARQGGKAMWKKTPDKGAS